MNSKQALEKIREASKMINFFKEQKSRSINNNLGNLGVIEKGKQEVKQIYGKFKDGCGELFEQEDDVGQTMCGKRPLCPNCQHIKDMHDAILGSDVK